MKRKGTKRRILVTLMAVMLLMATSVTAFAGSNSDSFGGMTGTITVTSSSCKGTSAAAGNKNVFVAARIKFRTGSGKIDWTSDAENTGAGYASTTRYAGSGNTGLSGETDHKWTKNGPAVVSTLSARAD